MLQPSLPPIDEMFDAFAARDASYDGIFITALRTTGIFCRPSCPARKPARDNVEFFASGKQALAHGYRPCKRCMPMEPPGKTPEEIRLLMQELDADPSLHITGRPPALRRDVSVVHLSRILTPVGPMIAGCTDDAVCLLEFTDRRMLPTQIERLEKRLGCAFVPGSTEVNRQLEEELAEYFDGGLEEFTVPIAMHGTSFQERVWTALRDIPHGQVRSYAEQARTVGSPEAVRAVGRANGDNRIAILIPCHRVIGSDGALTGYGGGLWRKKFLLSLERSGITGDLFSE